MDADTVLGMYRDEVMRSDREMGIKVLKNREGFLGRVDTDVPVKGNNKRKADARLKEILARYGDASVDFSKDVPFTDFYGEWPETHRHSIAPTTYDSYLKLRRKFK